MDEQGKFLLVVAIAGNLMNTMGAFISKEAKSIREGGALLTNFTADEAGERKQ